jgi:DHA1 family multidrug resistance protein-like MFS transporter
MPYYRRNLIVLSATIFLAAVSWNQIVPFLPLYLKELGVHENGILTWTGIVFSIQCLASIVAMPYWGKMGDRYGRKKMIIRAGLCLAGIYYGMSLCQAPWQLALMRFLNGALTGFIPGSMALISTNTPALFAAKYVTTAQTASAAGQIIGPALGGILAAAVGYRGSMMVSGTAVLICVFIVILVVKEPNKPEDVKQTSLLEDFAFSIKNPVVASLMAATFLSGYFINSVLPFLSLHLRTLSPHIKDWQSGTVFAFPAVALMLSAQAWRTVGKRFGYYKMAFYGMAGVILSCFILALCKTMISFCTVFLISGVFLAGISVCTAAATCEDVAPDFRGRAFGMQISSSVLGAFFAPLVAGWIGTVLGVEAAIALTGLAVVPVACIYLGIIGKRMRGAVS